MNQAEVVDTVEKEPALYFVFKVQVALESSNFFLNIRWCCLDHMPVIRSRADYWALPL
jgi:hypothetical protein